MCCAIRYHLCNLKNVKNTHGGVSLLVKLQVEAYNVTTESNTAPRFLNYINCIKSDNVSHVASLLNISTKNFDLKWNHVLVIKFTESCTAGGKWSYKKYIQKKLLIIPFPSNLSLLIVKISRAYN